ncbi:MAG: hypothetical protein DRJ03_19245 [Chloroflexi bacterium]|nr:MAG: hypothetical protein DRJ03_19245 [Chloroflexota bacterium]
MIAADTGHRYIDEDDYGPHNKAAWFNLITDSKNVVIQCPAMCRYVHCVRAFVVMMLRPLADIIASQERIGWGANEAIELARYENASPPIAAVKYDFWRNHQRPAIDTWLEVEYESLRGHPLWIDKRERAEFTARQTERIA